MTLVDVGQFAPTEHDRHDHFVLVLEEATGLIDLELDVVVAGLRTEPDFLDLRVVDVCFVLLLLLLIFEFAEIHDSAHGRLLVGGHLDKVETGFPGPGKSLLCGDDAQLGPLCRDHADRRDPDLLIDAMLLLDGFRLRRPPGQR